jgi:hypothetical protein
MNTSATYLLIIALIAKGSMNNLHRADIVSAFRTKGVDVGFLVRDDYINLIERLPGCRYLTCQFPPEEGRNGFWKHFCRHLRSLYPVAAEGRRYTEPLNRPWRKRLSQATLEWLSHFKVLMRQIRQFEKRLYTPIDITGIGSEDMDQLLLLGVGAHGSEHESALTWWAKQRGISVVHMIGNWDTFTSKGYPGAPVNTCLVWGEVMHDDAVEMHDIPELAIEEIGCLRYDRLKDTLIESREAFFSRIGLDPNRRTIMYAGPLSADQYYEMLAAFEELNDEGNGLQMIFRVYPHKYFMHTPYAKPLINYARSLPGVHVSLGDPDYRIGRRNEAVPNIEQFELWHSLAYSDVVVNYFSTIALEACFFDKPVISLAYRPMKEYGWIHPPKYADHPGLTHNRRLREYGAVHMVMSREELKDSISESIAKPDAASEARLNAVKMELGQLDGKVTERLAEVCVQSYLRHQVAMKRESS